MSTLCPGLSDVPGEFIFLFFLQVDGGCDATNISVRKTSGSISLIRHALKKMQMIATVEKDQETKGSGKMKMPYSKKETRRFHVLPPFLCKAKKAAALLEQWIKDNVILLPEVEFFPSVRDRKDPRYYSNHRKKWHTLGLVSLLEGSLMKTQGKRDYISRSCSPKHNDRGRGHVMMASYCEMEIERDE